MATERDLLTLMEQLGAAKVGFRSLTEAIDTTTPAGRMMMQMVGAFAEFERAILRERTRAGLEIARKDGRVGGRRPKLSERQQAEILRMIRRGEKTAAEADCSRSTRLRSAGFRRVLMLMPNNPRILAPLSTSHNTRGTPVQV